MITIRSRYATGRHRSGRRWPPGETVLTADEFLALDVTEIVQDPNMEIIEPDTQDEHVSTE